MLPLAIQMFQMKCRKACKVGQQANLFFREASLGTGLIQAAILEPFAAIFAAPPD
jgi:hypothetical protein